MDYESSQREAGMPLYDVVKLEVFTNYVDALRHLKDVEKHLATGQAISLREIDEFVGYVVALYIDLRPKLEYSQFKTKNGEYREDIAGLKKEFEPMLLNEHVDSKKSKDEVSLALAKYFLVKRCFLVMRTVLEEIGLTRVEFITYGAEHSAGAGMQERSKRAF